jgi:biotin transport system substrate-specific component
MMDIFIETTPVFSEKAPSFCKSLLQVVLGSFFLALCAKVTIPMQPVPLSLQTLGVFILAMMIGGRKAGLAGLLYLAQATVGLPVLAAGANPLWMFGPTAGYLVAFPIAAYVIGTLVEKKSDSSLWVMFSIFCGQLIIYILGALFLSRLIGMKMAVSLGVLPFLPLAGFKLILATSMSGLYLRIKKKFA